MPNCIKDSPLKYQACSHHILPPIINTNFGSNENIFYAGLYSSEHYPRTIFCEFFQKGYALKIDSIPLLNILCLKNFMHNLKEQKKIENISQF